MAYCEHCGKTAQVGNNVSFSKHRSKRLFHPNIQKTKVFENDKLVSKNLCTKCIKALTKVK